MIEKQKKLRTALIGLGRIGWQFHLPEISKKDGFELVAVVDPMDERLISASKKYLVKGYRDYKKMLEEQKPDLVVVASPTPFHKEHSIASFTAGCDVLCEKPISLDFSQFNDIINSAKKYNRKFMSYQPYRTYPETVAIKEILKKNLIGSVYMIRRSWFEYTRRNDWQSLKKFGGGMLNNYGSHFIDQLLHLSDYKVDKINCVARNLISPGDAEDFVKIILETRNKTILDIEINLVCPQPLPTWQILGKYGSIVINDKLKCWEIKYCKPNQMVKIELKSELAAEGRIYRKDSEIKWITDSVPFADYQQIDYYDKCYDYFALNKEPLVPIEEIYELKRILERCGEISRASDTLEKVNVPVGYVEFTKKQNAKMEFISQD